MYQVGTKCEFTNTHHYVNIVTRVVADICSGHEQGGLGDRRVDGNGEEGSRSKRANLVEFHGI